MRYKNNHCQTVILNTKHPTMPKAGKSLCKDKGKSRMRKNLRVEKSERHHISKFAQIILESEFYS